MPNFKQVDYELKITSIELEGNIIPVDIAIYDCGWTTRGLYVPYSSEMNALTEMAGNMSQTSGTSVSAGQQAAADSCFSRGVVQGIFLVISPESKNTESDLKAGHQVFLVTKNNVEHKV